MAEYVSSFAIPELADAQTADLTMLETQADVEDVEEPGADPLIRVKHQTALVIKTTSLSGEAISH